MIKSGKIVVGVGSVTADGFGGYRLRRRARVPAEVAPEERT
jgi:hypothetical protein